MLRLVTAPSAPIVTLAELKKHVRAEYYTDDDNYLLSLGLAAEQEIDGADGWLNRSLATQTWDYAIDGFPCEDKALYLPLPPLQSILSVNYTNSAGVTAPLAGYRVFNAGGSQPAYIAPAIDTIWPSTKRTPEAVTIRFTAGYITVPETIKQAIKLMVGHWFENREASSDVKMVGLPMAVESLLNRHKNWRG